VPGDTCPLHVYRPSFETRTAEWTGGGSTAAPAVANAPAATAQAERAEKAAQVEARRDDDDNRPEVKEPEKKKRGFWSRLFGRGKDKDDSKNDSKDDPKDDPKDDKKKDREP
jgi:hypothetical protein